MFMHGENDDFIVPENTTKNHKAYGGAIKNTKMFPGDHNAPRPADAIAAAIQFMKLNF